MNLKRTVNICDAFSGTKSSWVSSILGMDVSCEREHTANLSALTATVDRTVDLGQIQTFS